MVARTLAALAVGAGVCWIGLAAAQEVSTASTGDRPARHALAARIAELEDQVAELQKKIHQLQARREAEAKAESAKPGDFRIFTLGNAGSSELVPMLHTLLSSNMRNDPLRIVDDARTNSVIVTGTPEQLKIIESLLLRLDELRLDEQTGERDAAAH